MIIHYLQEMWKNDFKTWNIMGKNRTCLWITDCLWITANGFEQEVNETQVFVFLWNLLLVFFSSFHFFLFSFIEV